MIINYPGKYNNLKRFFRKYLLKLIHSYQQEINIPNRLFRIDLFS
jgi:hypothetical protein